MSLPFVFIKILIDLIFIVMGMLPALCLVLVKFMRKERLVIHKIHLQNVTKSVTVFNLT